jgi:beta-mannosidase
MFACSMYPMEEKIKNSIKKEIKHQISRLNRFSSIVLFSGNNENEEALKCVINGGSGLFNIFNIELWSYCKNDYENLLIDYNELYYNIIYKIFQEEQENIEYWPSSPSNGNHIYNPKVDIFGVIHKIKLRVSFKIIIRRSTLLGSLVI